MAKDRVLGVDIGAHSIKIAEVDFSGDRPEVTGYTAVAIPHGAIEDGLVAIDKRRFIVDALKHAVNSDIFSTKNAVVGFNSPNAAFMHTLTIGAMSEEDIEKSKVLLVEAADLGIDTAHQQIDFSVLGRRPRGNKIDVQFYYIQDEVAETICQIAEDAGLDLVGADLGMLAALRGAAIDMHGQGAQAVVNIGADTITVVVHHNGVPLYAFGDTVFAGNEASRLIADGLARDPDDPEVEKYKREGQFDHSTSQVVGEYASNLADRINNALGAYRRSTPDAPRVESILLAGGGSMLVGLAKVIQTKTNIRVQYAAADTSAFGGDLKHATLHLTAIGLTTGATE